MTDKVYQFIQQYIAENGYAPSHREISAACDLSSASVRVSLEWLEAQGRIRRKSGTARSIVLLDADSRAT